MFHSLIHLVNSKWTFSNHLVLPISPHCSRSKIVSLGNSSHKQAEVCVNWFKICIFLWPSSSTQRKRDALINSLKSPSETSRWVIGIPPQKPRPSFPNLKRSQYHMPLYLYRTYEGFGSTCLDHSHMLLSSTPMLYRKTYYQFCQIIRFLLQWFQCENASSTCVLEANTSQYFASHMVHTSIVMITGL